MRRWSIVFGAVTVGLLALGYLAVWAASGFQEIGLDLQGNIAIVLGSVLLSGLSVVLMALMFYSDRSGRDDAVARVHREDEDQG
jgi:hypothetical protein